jgi:NAD(P)-dependent dehydrogenase (short-subunit alcohol dehydrogenase family)
MLVAPLDAMVKGDFEEAMQIHFWAPYHLTMAALPYLRRNGESRIVNISSIGGRVAVPHMAPYCASKFALARCVRQVLQKRSRVTSWEKG